MIAGIAGYLHVQSAAPKLAPTPAPIVQPVVVQTTVTTGQRISYLPGHAPVLDLPGGKRQPITSLLNVGHKLGYGEFVWDDTGVPAGPVWVRVDLSRQLLSVFRGGHEIGTAVIIYGANGKLTPHGQFRVLEKDKDHRSQTYDAAMPYMLRLTNTGIALHASTVRERHATHGCIGTPIEFARHLFETMRLGDPVLVV